MNPAFRFLLTAIGISLLSMADPALPDSAVDTAEATDRVVLEAGGIDSSTVAVGSYVVVIHGQGERHPVSGEWEQLVTSRGYVYSVDAETLILFRRWDGEPELIPVGGIQTLVQSGSRSRKELEKANKTESFSPSVGNADSIQAAGEVEAARYCTTGADTNRLVGRLTETSDTLSKGTEGGNGGRVVGKLLHGTVFGFCGASLGAILGAVSGHYFLGGRNCSGDQSCGLAAAYGGLSGWVSGYSVGTAVAVSRVDPHDRFMISLLGSLVGTGVGGIVVAASDDWTYSLLGPWPFYAGSTIGATLFSEFSRYRHGVPRLSVGLVPNPKKGLSAVAKLHF